MNAIDTAKEGAALTAPLLLSLLQSYFAFGYSVHSSR